jgi:signal peptidase II
MMNEGDIILPVIALILAAIAVVADQFLKTLVVNQLKPVGTVTVIPNLLDLTYLQNSGAAFGILKDQIWLFIAITALISALIIFLLFTYQEHTFFSYAAAILIIAGGIGNLIDRVFYGYVVDYIHVSFFPPIFNFADCCVTVGCICFIIHILFFAERRRKSQYAVHHYHEKH